ncbi:ArdC-like ssDNA-binding domain-containing protein [Hydromonas duriensis]|uniref:Uncharacterized protein DUF1738 n=1 Tax=Hydromonas duriensis TaxID=1527608 RepID=A0A4R6Y018_9BURK|nr:ArdC family protein [Hydromonas duriensis]TDR27787.1 uncharacterized protein DUF1738 [Hydromonas duriensis]
MTNKHKTSAKANAVKKDIRQEVTDQIVGMFESKLSEIMEMLDSPNIQPFEKPWVCIENLIHKNGASNHSYRGINNLILAAKSMSMGYVSNQWMTYKCCCSFKTDHLKA